MALIKCSECGADISEKANICPKCGCPLDITKQIIANTKKKHNRKVITTIIIGLAIIITLIIVIGLIKYNNTPANTAVRLIKKDFGKSITVESIYYNSEINGCIVKFSIDGEDNTATVHLDDKTVGYQSIMDEYTEKSDKATTDGDKKKYAQELVDYMELYDIFWEYNLLMDGAEKSGWEKIK